MLEVNSTRIDWDLSKQRNFQTRREEYWKERKPRWVSDDLFQHPQLWMEIGSGTGGFFLELAKRHPEKSFIALERCKTRGKRLVEKTLKSGLANIQSFRANAVPALLNSIPDNSLERLYILYPCPYPKMSQRKNRWYLHAVMPHFIRALKPGGLFVWASDQKWYIDEAAFVCEARHGLKKLVHDAVGPNAFNHFDLFPDGRTKFERTFLANGQPCYELIVTKC